MAQNNNNNNNGIVSIHSEMTTKSKLILLYKLSEKQLTIFRYMFAYPKEWNPTKLWRVMGCKVHINTIRNFVGLLKENGMLQEIKPTFYSPGSKAHTIRDNRYSFYVLNAKGKGEFENQELLNRLVPKKDGQMRLEL